MTKPNRTIVVDSNYHIISSPSRQQLAEDTYTLKIESEDKKYRHSFFFKGTDYSKELKWCLEKFKETTEKLKSEGY